MVRALAILQPNGGEVWKGIKRICWRAWGPGWVTGDTIRLDYSSDGGVTWRPVTEAQSLSYAAGSYAWDTATVPSGIQYRLRATCNQSTSIQDASDANFMIHNTAWTFYVNDDSTSGDIYCAAAGNDANDGLTAATPKATIPAILDAYDPEPGDAFLIDSGTYPLNADIRTDLDGQWHSGAARPDRWCQGSDHEAVDHHHRSQIDRHGDGVL